MCVPLLVKEIKQLCFAFDNDLRITYCCQIVAHEVCDVAYLRKPSQINGLTLTTLVHFYQNE
jgi:hypothetical protein